jgi:hypothetical protein
LIAAPFTENVLEAVRSAPSVPSSVRVSMSVIGDAVTPSAGGYCSVASVRINFANTPSAKAVPHVVVGVVVRPVMSSVASVRMKLFATPSTAALSYATAGTPERAATTPTVFTVHVKLCTAELTVMVGVLLKRIAPLNFGSEFAWIEFT